MKNKTLEAKKIIQFPLKFRSLEFLLPSPLLNSMPKSLVPSSKMDG